MVYYYRANPFVAGGDYADTEFVTNFSESNKF